MASGVNGHHHAVDTWRKQKNLTLKGLKAVSKKVSAHLSCTWYGHYIVNHFMVI